MTSTATQPDQFIECHDIPSSRQVVRANFACLALFILGYFLLSSMFLLWSGEVAVHAVRLIYFSVFWGLLRVGTPQKQKRKPFPNALLEISGIWPEDWTPRRGARTSLISGLTIGGVAVWFLLEAVLSGNASWRPGATRGTVFFMLGLDMVFFCGSFLMSHWLWWEPFLNRPAVLTVAPEGINLVGYPMMQLPEQIPWSDIRKARVDKTNPPVLFLWYRPLRSVLGLKLPELNEQDFDQLKNLLSTLITTEPSKSPPETETEVPRRFDQLLNRLSEQRQQKTQPPEDMNRQEERTGPDN